VLEGLDREEDGFTRKTRPFVIETGGLIGVGTGGEIQVKHNEIINFYSNVCIIIDLFKHFMKK